MKKILLLGNINSIFIKELVQQLINKNTKFFLLDISNNVYYNFQTKQKKEFIKNCFLIKIPLLKFFFLTFFAKKFINNQLSNFDIIHILYNKI